MVAPVNTVTRKVPEEESGIPFDSISIPVTNEPGKLVAGLNVAVTMKNQQQLNDIITITENTTNTLLAKVQHIAAHSEELSATTEQISSNVQNAVDESAKVNEVTNEAARVGSAGAVFGVVADEVRKLSEKTNRATKNIVVP